jgi:hypothetical protein
VFLEDVYGTELRTVAAARGRPARYEVVVYLYVPKGRDPARGDPFLGVDRVRGRASEHVFEAPAQAEQIAWVNHICAGVRGITVAERTWVPRLGSPARCGPPR